MLRLIQEIAPDWIVGENVLGLTNWNGGVVFEEVCVDLEDKGYEVQPYILPASSKNAPHKRDRVWFVAYSNSNGYIKSVRGGDGEKEKISREHRQKNSTTREFVGTNKWNVANTISNGGQKSPRNVGQKSGAESERGNKFTDGINYNGSERNVTNTDSKTSGRKSKKLGCKNGEDEKERIWKFFYAVNTDGNEGNVTDTNNTRTRESMRTNGEWEKEDKGWEGQSQFEYRENGKYGDVTHTDRGESKCNWEEFPTQSPICGGDDGISTELDGITFPKWRRESIKGYGNAIVPQVVYSIFKTIEKYESTIKES